MVQWCEIAFFKIPRQLYRWGNTTGYLFIGEKKMFRLKYTARDAQPSVPDHHAAVIIQSWTWFSCGHYQSRNDKSTKVDI